jgi:3-oxoacyl-[acyl-carrier protein] reductase
MNLKLRNKTVFISASGQGIGAAIAKRFLQEDAKVLINDINESRLKGEITKLKKKYAGHIDGICGDISQDKVIHQAMNKMLKNWGRADILIANLGNGKAGSVDKLDLNDWQRLMEINLYATIKLLKIFLEQMKKQKNGSIVITTSIAGIQRSAAPWGYAAAKTALLTLTKNAASELADSHIRVNAVAPGNIFFKGGRWQEIIVNNPNIQNEYISKDVPLRRLGTPEEVAPAVAFLASPLSSFITGACLVIDGGEVRKFL